ncbi:MAG: chemotaxis protein CheX [Chthoniobacteraceae bacterium]|nr:chemotaxis protein CheX [Chthoniobacteraceae bacterium]
MKNLGISADLLDALLETANIGVGRAAASLCELTGRPVEISVPELVIFKIDQPIQMADLRTGTVLRVAQRFYQGLNGHALLLLNESGAKQVAKLILSEEIDVDAFGETEQSALLELCNIMINGVMGSIANQLDILLSYDVPFLDLKGVEDFGDLVADLLPNETGQIVFMQAALTISAETVHGYIVMVLDEVNLATLLACLAHKI